jgi:hypothetical protein
MRSKRRRSNIARRWRARSSTTRWRSARCGWSPKGSAARRWRRRARRRWRWCRRRARGQSLLETLAAQLLLHGNGYVQVMRDGAGKPVELFALRPERVAVVAGEDGWPASYKYTVGDKVLTLPVEYQIGGWLFATPRDGMRLLDRATGQEIRYREGWQRPATPLEPAGGTTVDSEARAAIAELVEVLIVSGILAQS